MTRDPGHSPAASRPWHQLPDSREMEIGWLIKPFIKPDGTSGIALDGGENPLLSIMVPELSFGADLRHPLHLALLIDWQSESSLAQLRRIYALYQNDGAASLPPLRLTLLPIFSNPESSELRKWINLTYRLSGEIDTYSDLVHEIAHRAEPMTPADIEAFLHQAEPGFIERVGLMTHPEAESIEGTHQAAEAQLKRNATLLDLHTAPQLTAIDKILTSAPDADVLKEFLIAAMAYQDAYLSSPGGLAPIAPDFGCHCQDKSHPHQTWKPAIASQFPSHYPFPDPAMPDAGAIQPEKTTYTGPQIQLPAVVHATEQPQPGKTITHTVEFENIGGAELEIHGILLNEELMTLQHWDRRVPPASRGSFTVGIHHQPKQAATVQSIWIRNNSHMINDIDRGHEVILRIPAAASSHHPASPDQSAPAHPQSK